jgi:hypothetical protein
MASNEKTMETAAMTAKLVIALACFAALQAGCMNPGYVDEANAVPVALARVVGPDGMATTTMVTFPFSGQPVAVTLDSAGSTDRDGRIASHQWIASNPMMPMERMILNGASPQVSLGEGTWTFSLWVTDEKGKVSRPDTVTFVVGTPTMPMGGAGGASGGAGGAGGAAGGGALTADMCVAMTAAAVAMPCKECICAIDSCRSMVIESACDATCWALLDCIGMNCPDAPTSCIPTTCLTQYMAYSAGPTPAGATAAGACATMCPDAC